MMTLTMMAHTRPSLAQLDLQTRLDGMKLLKRVHIPDPKTDPIGIKVGSNSEEEGEVTEVEVIVEGMIEVGAEGIGDGGEEAIKIDAEDILFRQETCEVMPPHSSPKTYSLNLSRKGLPFHKFHPP
jgi:hypothetical protein